MDCMSYPNTIDEFIDNYSFKDKEEIYTNGSELIPVFRVKQALEYYYGQNKPKQTNFDYCYESIENMASIIDIAKVGWTKEQIIEWLKKEVEDE